MTVGSSCPERELPGKRRVWLRAGREHILPHRPEAELRSRHWRKRGWYVRVQKQLDIHRLLHTGDSTSAGDHKIADQFGKAFGANNGRNAAATMHCMAVICAEATTRPAIRRVISARHWRTVLNRERCRMNPLQERFGPAAKQPGRVKQDMLIT